LASLTKRTIDASMPEDSKEIRLWDDDPRGFGIRIKPSGVKTFFVQYRSPVTFKKARHTIGQYGRLTLDEARREARKILGCVEKGEDPAEELRKAKTHALTTAGTVSSLCDDYMRDALAGKVTYRGKSKKTTTLEIDGGRINRHIKPLLGKCRVTEVTQKNVEKFMHDVRLGKTATVEKTKPRGKARVTGGDGTARRAVGLLGSIFSYAVKEGLRSDNPVTGIERAPDNKRTRSLSPDEYRAFGTALDALEEEGSNPIAIRAIRVLALSGCRRGEVYGLQKTEVDTHHQCFRFVDTKTGQQVRAVGRSVMDLIQAAPEKESVPFVFPATRSDGHLKDVKVFRKACEKAKLENVTIHTLRHSFATAANELEYSEITIAGLLGHGRHSTTARYTHLIDHALVTAADRVSALIAARMEGRDAEGADVVPLWPAVSMES
jgi:integrase